MRPVELLRTQRVLLRRWTQDDAAAFLDIYGHDEVASWLGPHPRRAVTDLDEARVRLHRWHAREAGLPAPFGLWAMVEVGGSTGPIGTVLLLPLRDDDGDTDEVEIGWHLHPDAQGRGLVTEAACALLDQAAQHGVARVLALTDLDNLRSQAVARRLGMIDEGSTDRWFGMTTRQFSAVLPTPARR